VRVKIAVPGKGKSAHHEEHEEHEENQEENLINYERREMREILIGPISRISTLFRGNLFF